MGGVSLAQKPERYVDFVQAKSHLQQRAINLRELNQYNCAQQVDRILSKHPQATSFVPLKANAVLSVTMLAFIIHCALFVWIFMVKSTLKVWLAVVLPSVLMTFIYLLLQG